MSLLYLNIKLVLDKQFGIPKSVYIYLGITFPLWFLTLLICISLICAHMLIKAYECQFL